MDTKEYLDQCLDVIRDEMQASESNDVPSAVRLVFARIVAGIDEVRERASAAGGVRDDVDPLGQDDTTGATPAKSTAPVV